MGPEGSENKTKRSLHLEDVIILISVGLLFWLGVLRRHETVAQVLLVGVLIVMLVVFLRRIRRTYRAFKEKQDKK